MKKLNRRYRGKNRPTDVLSFAQEEFKADPKYLGDILIASTTTRKQAKQSGKSPTEEARMLAVHGLLHLLGYDHATPRQEKEMFGIQNRLLKKRI